MSTQLDRSSFVPLYYQLQEVLKERIESGEWRPGDRLPSEPDLARRFAVSRVVVRQALAILEDDRQIVRVRGSGTFVARPKLDFRAGGLSRQLVLPRSEELSLQVLDKRVVTVEGGIQENLRLAAGESALRITTLMSLRRVPLAIGYSFFRPEDAGWLDRETQVGRAIAPDRVLSDHGLRLTHSTVHIETSQCGQFEADRFGIPRRSAVFLVLCTEYRHGEGAPVPFEVARIEYRGDILRLQLGFLPEPGGEMAVTWSLNDQSADGR
jgi:GntR family transcriptional regulator